MQIAKYNASGNDFVIFHTFKDADFSAIAKLLCHRQNSIGADGLIVLLPHEKFDFQWRFYNNDGSEASMCGNGSRACAHYAYTNGLANTVMQFLTKAGAIECSVQNNIVESALTPVEMLAETFHQEGLQWYFYDTGVPHLVAIVDDLDAYDQKLARKMRNEYNANVNFVTCSNGELRVRTYERGVEDETLACGTGMSACFYALHVLGRVGVSAKVYPKSGEELHLRIDNNKLFFKGKVEKVFDTSIECL